MSNAPYPPMLIIAMDSETDVNPLEDGFLSWSSPYNAVTELATVIAVLYDPYDVYDVDKIREGFPPCNLTKKMRVRMKNAEKFGFKKVTTIVYSAEERKVPRNWESNIKMDYIDRAKQILEETFGMKIENEKQIDMVRVVASRLMKEDITRDIMTLADRVKYSMVVAQNLNFDYNTMIAREVADKLGWKLAFYTNTTLSAGEHLDSPNLPMGDFLGIGSFGMMFKVTNTGVKTLYLIDSFGQATYALVKKGHFIRIEKKAVSVEYGSSKEARQDYKFLGYNIRDVEILIDLIFHFPETLYTSVSQVEEHYGMLKVLKDYTLDIEKEIYLARYRGDKKYAVEFTRKIKERDETYSFDGYIMDAYDENVEL